jgi:hypothetical protein
VHKRALVICRHDYWPGLTPDKLWELDYDLWATLALACDQISADRAAAAEEMKRKARG